MSEIRYPKSWRAATAATIQVTAPAASNQRVTPLKQTAFRSATPAVSDDSRECVDGSMPPNTKVALPSTSGSVDQIASRHRLNRRQMTMAIKNINSDAVPAPARSLSRIPAGNAIHMVNGGLGGNGAYRFLDGGRHNR
jgi:hypothetical protein